MSEVVLTADNLTRYFGRKCAVDHVSFALPRGSITALLGRNGSGKTTLLRMLMGLLEPTGGRSTVLGQASGDLTPAARARIAYVAEGHPLYGWMKIRALAKHQAALYPRWNWDIYRRVIDHFQLDESAKAGRLSRGQTAGVSLAIALAPDPELLVLDDPSLGLDPVARRAMLQAIVELFGQGDRTILLSTHELQDVERIADRVLVLDQSVLLVDADKDHFLNHVAEYVIDGLPETDALTGGTATSTVAAPSGASGGSGGTAASRGRMPDPSVPQDLPKLPGVISVRREGPRLHILTAQRSAEALERLRLWGRPVEERSVSLEDAVIGYLSRRGIWGPSQGDVR